MATFVIPKEIYWWGQRRRVDLEDPRQRAWLTAFLIRSGREREVTVHLSRWERADLRRALEEEYVPDHLRRVWEAVLAVGEREQGILTPDQERVVGIVAGCRAASAFALAGGTALAACYLRHRLSEDLDFFTWDRGACEDMLAEFTERLTAEGIPFECPGDQGATHKRVFVGESRVKVEFAYDGAYRINADRATMWGVQIESLEDIAAGKMCALFGRAQPRDFVDVYFLAERMGKDRLLALAKRKDPGFDRYWFAQACAQAQKVDFSEVQMVKEVAPEAIRSFFRRWAEELLEQLLSERPEA